MPEDAAMKIGIVALISVASISLTVAFSRNAWTTAAPHNERWTKLHGKKAGTFFNQVPESSGSEEEDDESKEESVDPIDSEAADLLRQRKGPSLASQPSTINGKPTAGVGFGQKLTPPGDGKKSFVGIGPRLNDPTKPEYDDQGYTLYSNETTGEKSRVFEALVDYPCKFTMKIVGAQEGNFVQEMVELVADSCQVEAEEVGHSVRKQGKWVSMTVRAPVKSAEMLYSLYENVDKDPRVKFKF